MMGRTDVTDRLWRALVVALLWGMLASLGVWSVSHAEEPGGEVQLCTCLATLGRAEAIAAEFRRMVPGLETDVRPSNQRGRTVYEIWARHPAKTPEDICTDIGKAECVARQGAQVGSDCDGSSRPSE